LWFFWWWCVYRCKNIIQKLNFGDLTDRIRICVPSEDYDPSKIFEKFGNAGIVNLYVVAIN
jgi:hypothetical protein